MTESELERLQAERGIEVARVTQHKNKGNVYLSLSKGRNILCGTNSTVD